MSDLLESGPESGLSLGLSSIRERRSPHSCVDVTCCPDRTRTQGPYRDTWSATSLNVSPYRYGRTRFHWCCRTRFRNRPNSYESVHPSHFSRRQDSAVRSRHSLLPPGQATDTGRCG
jgi:hypothetical protein